MPTRSASTWVRDAASAVPSARQQARQRDVVGECERRQQVEELKDEADAVASQPRELAVTQRGEWRAVESDLARAGAIHGAAQVQECRFPATRRPHERDEVAALQAEGDAAQRVYGGVAARVALVECLRGDQRHPPIV